MCKKSEWTPTKDYARQALEDRTTNSSCRTVATSKPQCDKISADVDGLTKKMCSERRNDAIVDYAQFFSLS